VTDQDEADEADDGALVEHPDGWHWIAPDGHQQFGPFETRAQAVFDRDHIGAETADDETLQEVERASGIADHVDVENGRPLDDESPQ
jgi:hypothetical protein